MKAMFEDYFGDSLTAQKNYRSADSAYAILIKEYATDSLRYAGSRINRALNMALMTDNIAILEEEVELTKKIFPKTWKGPEGDTCGIREDKEGELPSGAGTGEAGAAGNRHPPCRVRLPAYGEKA
jgi:hypothetical protein